jgi:hypothetical protein
MVFELGKNIYFSTYPPPTLIHLSRRLTSASKPAAEKSFDYCLSDFRTSVLTSSSSEKRLPLICLPLDATDTSRRKQGIVFMTMLCTESFYPQKTHNKTLLFGRIHLNFSRHFG